MKKTNKVIILGIFALLCSLLGILVPMKPAWWIIPVILGVGTIVQWCIPSREQRIRKKYKKNWKEKQKIT
jgi:hypothetical protein